MKEAGILGAVVFCLQRMVRGSSAFTAVHVQTAFHWTSNTRNFVIGDDWPATRNAREGRTSRPFCCSSAADCLFIRLVAVGHLDADNICSAAQR